MPEDLVVVPGATKWFVDQFRWPNSVMYHYTSREALDSILASRRMWAMDLRSMNDPRELVYGKKLIDKRMAKAAQRARGTPTEKWLQAIRKMFEDLIVTRSSTFSISLSESPNMPNQWRDYSANGTGFVLGWSIDSDYPGLPLKTWVTYDREKQVELIDGLIEFHAGAMRRGLLGEAANRRREWINSAYSLFRFLNAVWLTFKESSWSDEAEFRCIYHVFDEYLPDWCAIKTRPDTSRRYIEADFGPVELKYVGIGPRNEPAAARRFVDDLLKRYNFPDVRVSQSALSLE